VRLACELAWGRPPRGDELARALEFVFARRALAQAAEALAAAPAASPAAASLEHESPAPGAVPRETAPATPASDAHRPPAPADGPDKNATPAAAPSPADDALVDLCHVLLNSSEFLYVE
jgi:hypothetical protein